MDYHYKWRAILAKQTVGKALKSCVSNPGIQIIAAGDEKQQTRFLRDFHTAGLFPIAAVLQIDTINNEMISKNINCGRIATIHPLETAAGLFHLEISCRTLCLVHYTLGDSRSGFNQIPAFRWNAKCLAISANETCGGFSSPCICRVCARRERVPQLNAKQLQPQQVQSLLGSSLL